MAGRKSAKKRERDIRRAMGDFPGKKAKENKSAHRSGRSGTKLHSSRGSEANGAAPILQSVPIYESATIKKSAPLHDSVRVKPVRRTSRRGADTDSEQFVECIFSYSGRGFGFAAPILTEDMSAGKKTAKDIFIPPRDTMGAMTGDRVMVAINHGFRADDEGEVVSIIEANCTSMVGTLHIEDGYAYVIPSMSRMNVAVSVPMKDCETLGIGENTKVEVIPEGAPAFNRAMSIMVNPYSDIPYLDTRGRISEVFGDADTKEANYAAVLYEAGIRTEFPDKVLEAAEKSANQPLVADAKERRDLRDRRIFTIDGAGAKDLDDAVSIEETADGYILGVHIADVSHYVPYGSAVEKEAAARGTSVYFTDKVVPMLPQCLSNGSCSLNAGEDKYALSAEIILDKNGVWLGTRIYKSIIRSTVRGVYSEVNDLLENGVDSEFYSKYEAVYGDLLTMHRLYSILRENGYDRGVLELEDSEAVIILDETGFPVDIVKRERGDAERIIEQFMLQANMGVAETMMSHNLPCLYRIHEEPDPDKIRDFAVFAHNIGLKTHNISNIVKEPAEKSDTDGLSQKSRRLSEKLMLILDEADEKGIADIVSSVLLRCMMKAKYSAECRGHFGLGADLYCHFTSPIRRYPDYFVHSVISTVLAESTSGALTCGCCGFDGIAESAKVALLRKSAGDRAECANDCEVRAVTAERDIEDLYKALFMSNRIGERFEAAVCSVIKFGVFVRMSNLVEGLVPASMFENAVINEELHTLRSKGRTYTLGTVLEVELIEADVSTGRITFKPVL